MKTHAKVLAMSVAALMFAVINPAEAADGSVGINISNNVVLLKVDGDKDDDWWIQSSTNLTTWTTLTNFGTLLSGNVTNAPWRSAGTKASVPTFYRAKQTLGFYDTNLLRTITISYTQATLTAFTQQLTAARTYSTNVYSPQMTLDNGATNLHIGVRYKGNTSFTGAGQKKSFNVEVDYILADANVMDYSTLNLNNANGDETIMREPIYFTLMAQYCCSPVASLAKVYLNNNYRGVYSLAQQEDGQLMREHFPSNDGDRWRTPNNPTATGIHAFGWRGNTNISTYSVGSYDLRSTKAANTNDCWARLINAINILNNTPTNQIRTAAEDVFAVDSWLWFLAIENLFVDDDSYFNKGADYSFYWEAESGRIHPVEHDGNESFAATMSLNTALSPIYYFDNTNRPLLYKFLNNNELRQRYLAHMRTAVDEYFNPTFMTKLINHFHALSIDAIIADPLKNYTMSAYTNDLVALKTYVTNRYTYMKTNAFMTPLQPNINSATVAVATVYATNIPTILANVTSQFTNSTHSGVGSVWLYFRDKPYGKFTVRQMFDNGLNGDGAAGDGVYGAVTTNYPAGNKIHYYIEARATNAAQAARFSPARAERDTHSYNVSLSAAAGTSVVINEFMASNSGTLADPQGQFDDWIELRNLTGSTVNLTGLYLTDNAANPRKWQFPSGTTIPANGYLLVWADDNTLDSPGLHASFKLAAAGEEILLIDTDANNNQVLDSITFGAQATDISYGRTAVNPDVWGAMLPTPMTANQ
jgi:spore coat protein CotH